MRILLLTWGPQTVASSRVRALQYVPYFEEYGWHCHTFSSIPTPYSLIEQSHIIVKSQWFDKYFSPILSKLYSIYFHAYRQFQLHLFRKHLPDFDLLFIQKVLLNKDTREKIQNLGKFVVFEFDDAIYTLNDQQRRQFNAMLELADLTITTNEDSRAYAQDYSSQVLRIVGPIDTRRYQPSDGINRQEIVIGWIGSPYTINHVDPILNSIKKVLRQRPQTRFHIIGADFPSISDQMQSVPWRYSTELVELATFDIGIMPLTANDWSRGKGGYKLLQYMACGIPCVASPVGINKELIRHGENGFLANTNKSWEESLLTLIDDPSLRQKMGMNGRKIAVGQYSLDRGAARVISAIETLQKSLAREIL